MGTQFIHNDSLQITREQGFPKELVYEKQFHDKQGLRFYQAQPTRNFLIENRDGKFLYWGLVYILELHLDYMKQIASGKFKIIYINTPEEMKKAYDLIDRRPEMNFFEK